ncbi:hypothetical protein CJ030_MR7G008126 [Morella rubra]|uniref:Vacuolar iron transporter n=1 Tax=Morella rubra TaxID=262757 RepID=A0A6A1V4W3_9ROSI|nr:hypothetical protein CJ030_MR7G008126 [Morella rubra]
MATKQVPDIQPIKEPKPLDVEAQTQNEGQEIEVFDYTKRAQWLRAAVLGANDGLLSVAALMMGVGAVKKDPKTMILSGVAGLVGGACSMAIGELVSVYSQYDIEMSQLKRGGRTENMGAEELDAEKEKLPNPWQAAGASALAFSLGALLPLLSAAFIKDYTVRVAVIIVVVSLALLGFGGLSAVLGKAPVVKSSLRVLLGGWLALALTFGLTKLVGTAGL